MPDEQIEQNEEEAQEQPRKKKGGRKLLIVVLIVIMAGGGGGFYFWRKRAAAKAQAAKTAASDHKGEKGSPAEGPDDTEVKEVIELQPFIVNLADTTETRYLRMTISLGVGESHEEKVDPLFTTRVRNAILATITTKTSDQILTVEGKTELRKEMLQAARATVDQPQIHAIYITDFIVQM
jgi:flagellar protein FliL